MAHVTDSDLIDAFVLGRSLLDRELLLKSAALLATFGLVYREPRPQANSAKSPNSSITLKNLTCAVQLTISAAGVSPSPRGRAVLLQPSPIATSLAERQWGEWSPAEWDDVLAGDVPPRLRASAARQLALLNTTDTARPVTDSVCRPDGPFDGFERLAATACAEVLSSLAEVNRRSSRNESNAAWMKLMT